MQFNSQSQCFQDGAFFKSNSSLPPGFTQTETVGLRDNMQKQAAYAESN